MAKPEVFISVDIEADGPIPGEFSMLSLGAAAFFEGSLKPVGTFSANLKPLPGAKQNPSTMEWWATKPDAWAEATKDAEDPVEVMSAFRDWVQSFGARPVFVGYPVAWDFCFVYWYYWKFIGEQPPWGHQGLDIKTLAWTRLGGNYHHTTKSRSPKRWFAGTERDLAHRAVDDAVSQGVLFLNILKDKA